MALTRCRKPLRRKWIFKRRLRTVVSKSSVLDGEVAELQADIGGLSAQQLKIYALRADEREIFPTTMEDLEHEVPVLPTMVLRANPRRCAYRDLLSEVAIASSARRWRNLYLMVSHRFGCTFTDSFRVSACCLPPVMALRVMLFLCSLFSPVSNVRQVSDFMICPCASWAPPCLGACVGAAAGCPRTAPLWPKPNAGKFSTVVVVGFLRLVGISVLPGPATNR